MEESISLLNIYLQSIEEDLVLCKDRLHKMFREYDPKKEDSIEKLKEAYSEFNYYLDKIFVLSEYESKERYNEVLINSTKRLFSIIQDDIDHISRKKGIHIIYDKLNFTSYEPIILYNSFIKGFSFLLAAISEEKKRVKIECMKHNNELIFEIGPFKSILEEYIISGRFYPESKKDKSDIDKINLFIAINIFIKTANCNYEINKKGKNGFYIRIKLRTKLSKEYIVKDFKNKTILVVNDEKRQVESLFLGLNAKILWALDGKMGIDKFKEHEKEIDLILMDWMMPFMDGDEATKAIRKMNSKVPIIRMSIDIKLSKEKLYDIGYNDNVQYQLVDRDRFEKIIIKYLE